MKVDEAKILSQVSKLTGQAVTTLQLVYQKNYIVLEDATTKAAVYKKNKPVAFVIVSAEGHPNTLLENQHKTIQMVRRLGDKSARRVLIADIVDVSNGLSYSITKYHRRISASHLFRFIQKRVLGTLVVRWLIDTLESTSRKATVDETQKYFIEPLEAFLQHSDLKVEQQNIVSEALSKIKTGSWQPVLSCAHNDLWSGNVLLKNFLDFVIIDWGGASESGYPFYDFIRASESFQLPKLMANKLLRQYCSVIGCDSVQQIKYYLAANFAVQSTSPGHWSKIKCLETMEECCKYIDRITA